MRMLRLVQPLDRKAKFICIPAESLQTGDNVSNVFNDQFFERDRSMRLHQAGDSETRVSRNMGGTSLKSKDVHGASSMAGFY